MNLPGQEKQPPKNNDLSCPTGIYIHIPFCRQKCLYCDFVSGTDLSLIEDYVKALCAEISLRRNLRVGVDSIYFGGGTPTLLTPDQAHLILAAVHRAFTVDSDVEITIEANPETITLDALKQFVAMGIDRISLGVQSFQPAFLKLLGRGHDEKTALAALEMAHTAGLDQIGLDLIFGIPGQTVKLLTRDLQTALKFSPHHLSCYCLTVALGTPFEKHCQKGVLTPLDDSKMAILFEKTSAFLTGHGYEQYEISNYAKPGCRSRHNQKYWSGAPYIGLGVAAHSYLPPVRSWNDSSIDRYITAISQNRRPIAGSETLTAKERAVETIMLGLRTDQGVDLAFLDELQWCDNGHAKNQLIQRWIIDESAMIRESRLVLTTSGMLLADGVTGALIELLG